MNPFQTRSIQLSSKEPSDKVVPKSHPRSKTWIKSHLILSILVVILGLFTLKGVWGAVQMGKPFSVKQIVLSGLGNTVQTDNYGHTNILLVGVGGEGHDGENLTDTMIVASLNHKDNSVSMVSIPRDIYVENEAVGWGTRINSIYEYILDETEDPLYAMSELKKEIETIVDVPIHYYAKIDFRGFTEVVDALGGITVNVQEHIVDQTYPAAPGTNRTYEPFYLDAGVQKLDGETALKYARSRHSSSDFDRARRQQEVLQAIKDRALSVGFLASPGRIKDTYSAITENFETSMTLSEMLSLVNFAEDLGEGNIYSTVLHDEATKMGGFLYTPPREEGDPYYLLPYSGNWDEIQVFAQLFFYHPELYREQTPLQVLNGTKEASLAGLTKMFLTRYGFNVVQYGNATERDHMSTRIITLNPLAEATVELLPSLIQGEITETIPLEYQAENWLSQGQIIIELGQDFVSYYKEHDELFYIGVY